MQIAPASWVSSGDMRDNLSRRPAANLNIRTAILMKASTWSVAIKLYIAYLDDSGDRQLGY